MKYLWFMLLLTGCAIHSPELPTVIRPIKPKTLPVVITKCQVQVCTDKTCSTDLRWCMDRRSAVNYGLNTINSTTYIKQLENLLGTVTGGTK